MGKWERPEQINGRGGGGGEEHNLPTVEFISGLRAWVKAVVDDAGFENMG